jgi:endoglucanase
MKRQSPAAFSSASSRKILQELCSVPTAPFVEHEVVRYVEAFVKQRRGLTLKRDRFGNLLIELPGLSSRGRSDNNPPRWVFTAHMDHPGFVAEDMLDRRTLEASFYGGVAAEYFAKSRVKFFDSGREITGRVTGYRTSADGRPLSATIRVSAPVVPNALGMWDQGIGRFVRNRFLSRVCDDLAGAAGALAMIDHLAHHPAQSPVAVLLTRGEEEGFIGAIAASRHPTLLRKSDRIVAIECSPEQPFAPQGNGAIIRVGDRTSIFNSALTYFMTQTATDLAATTKRFKFQRALMPGGTCEATVYDAYGFHAASICVPLGNYHNMDRKKKKIAPEYIDINDWNSMTRLFIELARRGHEYAPGHQALKKKLRERFEKFKKLL